MIWGFIAFIGVFIAFLGIFYIGYRVNMFIREA